MKAIYSLFVLIIAIAFLSGCASQVTTNSPISLTKPNNISNIQEKRSMLIGTWYGEAPVKEGGYRQWIVYNYDDGTDKTIFRVYDNKGKYKEQIEVGEWGISGDILFTIMKGWIKNNQLKPADPTNTYYYDAYRVINLTPTIFEYEAIEYGEKFTVKKVKDDFQFPEIIVK